MTRLTEYHNGVAVIKGKRYKEAAEKLAMCEDIVDGLTDADILRLENYTGELIGFTNKRKDAEEVAKENGWVQTGKNTWKCPECIAKLAELKGE